MSSRASRRNFLAAGLTAPAAALATPQKPQATPATPAAGLAAQALEYRTLGKTGLKVTSLSFGCMTTSDQSVVERAADLGILHFDTARGYMNGNNERMLGAALKGRRKQAIVASKSHGETRQAALAELDTSLRELDTDYLDIWYLHGKSSPSEVTDELLEAQRVAKQAGKIRFAGVSTHYNMDQILAHLVKLGQTDVVLTTYNFAMKNVAMANQPARVVDMTAAIRAAREAGMGIIAMKVMAGGVERAARGDRLYGAAQEPTVKALSQEGGRLAAVKWALKNEFVDTAIVCMRDMDQLDENLRAMAEPYTDKDEKILTQTLAYISPLYCRMCGSCGGVCDKGMPVADLLRILTYADGYGEFALARERFLQLPAVAGSLRCSDCQSCSVDCPNGVRVRERLMRAQALFA
jgi:hypothetical protein